jgi:hypothetical protein
MNENIAIIEDAYIVGGCAHGQIVKLWDPGKEWEFLAPNGKLVRTNDYKDTGRTVAFDGKLLRVFVFYDNDSFKRGE